MTLWWIADIVLVVLVLPIVIYLLTGVLKASRSIVQSVDQIERATAAGSKDLDQVRQTVSLVAGYGGSLDVILDDAE